MKFSLSTSVITLLAATHHTHPLASAQVPDQVCESTFPYSYDSGDTKAASTVISHKGAPWIQLDLSMTQLAPNARVVLTGERATQELDAGALVANGYSAVFDGSSVALELVTAGGGRLRGKGEGCGDGQSSRVVVSAVNAGVCAGDVGAESICGPTDDRVPSTDVRVGRIGGCTGWLIGEDVFVQAGHCGAPSGSRRLHFAYGAGSAPVVDQYAVDVASYRGVSGGVGNDWGAGRLLPNSSTGLLPGAAQTLKCEAEGMGPGCGWFDLGAVPTQTSGNNIRITGYGTAAVDSRSQKTHVGALASIGEKHLRYMPDTTGGNSGSPVIHEETGRAVGVHTHGGCSSTGAGSNIGTRIDQEEFAAHIDFLTRSCAQDAECDDGVCENGAETCDANARCQFGTTPNCAASPSPTPNPTKALTASPTNIPDPIVRIQSSNSKRYLWVAPDGSVKTSANANQLANIEITLKRYECPGKEGDYYFDQNLATPCYLVEWDQSSGRRLYAKNNEVWKEGVGTMKDGPIWKNQRWFLEPVACGNEGNAEGTCALLRNARNGRSMYDSVNNGVVGASPEGDPYYVWTNDIYRWHFIDVATGTALDVTRLANRTPNPTEAPSPSPTPNPTKAPTASPTASSVPSLSASADPSSEPTDIPSSSPSDEPSGKPTGVPSSSPSADPSSVPTDVPSSAPSIDPNATASPTTTPDPVVRIQNINTKRYLWVAPDGSVKTSANANQLANTVITLKRYECPSKDGDYYFDQNLSAPCYLVVWNQSAGRRLYAKNGEAWRYGVGTMKDGSIWKNQRWFLEPVACGNEGNAEGTCALLRNARNGRSIYDSVNNGVVGASPEGDPRYVWNNDIYRWHFIDVATGTALDVTRLA